MGSEFPDLGEFAASFSEFVARMNVLASGRESLLLGRLREHLGVDPKELPSTTGEFAPTDHPNLQLALEAVLPDAELIGLATQHPGMLMGGIATILSSHPMVGGVDIGPVQYRDVEVGDGRVVRCVAAAVWLASRDGVPVALMLSNAERPWRQQSLLRLDGVSPQDGVVSALLSDLRAAMREHNVYRGRVISLHGAEEGQVTVQFHNLPHTARDAVVLPRGTIERLERHAIGVATHAARLAAAGRHLKRGILLHGPPGTGKTLTINYLLAAMPGRTTVILTGRGLGLVQPAVTIARELAPATVVLEDVDLVAAERTMPVGSNTLLFELLNQMEGLAEDADLLFLLTTNRADLIEPALATRPGRVDLALEIPLPDANARRRLIELYGEEMRLDDATEQDLVARTDGLSGAFIKELMRQAALRAALQERPPSTADVVEALDELLDERATLTSRLLGRSGTSVEPSEPATAAFPAMLHAFGAAGIPVTRSDRE